MGLPKTLLKKKKTMLNVMKTPLYKLCQGITHLFRVYFFHSERKKNKIGKNPNAAIIDAITFKAEGIKKKRFRDRDRLKG